MNFATLLYESAPTTEIADVLAQMGGRVSGSDGWGAPGPEHPGISAKEARRLWKGGKAPARVAERAVRLCRSNEFLGEVLGRDKRIGVTQAALSNPAITTEQLAEFLRSGARDSYELRRAGRNSLSSRIHEMPCDLALIDHVRGLNVKEALPMLTEHPGLGVGEGAEVVRALLREQVASAEELVGHDSSCAWDPELLAELLEHPGVAYTLTYWRDDAANLPDHLLDIVATNNEALEMLLDNEALSNETALRLIRAAIERKDPETPWSAIARHEAVPLEMLGEIVFGDLESTAITASGGRYLTWRLGEANAQTWRLTMELAQSFEGTWAELVTVVEATLI